MAESRSVLEAARHLRQAVAELRFGPPVTQVYNPLEYAWTAYRRYLRLYGHGKKRVLFLGLNPGPFGMVQTGVPFGQVRAVRDWLGIEVKISPPTAQHPKRPINGFACTRNEISGERLWGFFAGRFGSARQFFRDHLVLNYCPLAFLEASGRNRTPDKLPASEREPLFDACDDHLREMVRLLKPEWLIGIGEFAARRARQCLPNDHPRICCVLHPSPANPAANVNWAAVASTQLAKLGGPWAG
jgi:single-strand selective monofunctional uracil DNA glycosylase